MLFSTEWCTNVTHPSKRYEVRSDVDADASKPCKPKWNAIDAIGNKSNNEMHGGAAPRPDMHRWQSGEVAVKRMKTRSREQAAADGMKCTAARHMFSSCMQDVHHAKNVHKQTCKMHEMENMQRTWSEMHVPSFSTPAGLRPNTNVGLHIPFGPGPCAGALELPLKSKRECMEYWPRYVAKSNVFKEYKI